MPYTYVNGNPVNLSDPDGHEPRCVAEVNPKISCAQQAKLDKAAAARTRAADRRTKSVNMAWTLTFRDYDKAWGTDLSVSHRALLERGNQDLLDNFRNDFVIVENNPNRGECGKSWWCKAITDPDVQAVGASAGIPIELIGAKLVMAARARLAAAAAAEGLPKLTGTIAESFEGGQYVTKTFKAGTKFYRAERWGDKAPGSFLGAAAVGSKAEAEAVYYIAKWNDAPDVLRTYRLESDVTMYFGKVAHGEGYQGLLPKGVNPKDVLRQIGARPLE